MDSCPLTVMGGGFCMNVITPGTVATLGLSSSMV
jgi:hypothetical protein